MTAVVFDRFQPLASRKMATKRRVNRQKRVATDGKCSGIDSQGCPQMIGGKREELIWVIREAEGGSLVEMCPKVTGDSGKRQKKMSLSKVIAAMMVPEVGWGL